MGNGVTPWLRLSNRRPEIDPGLLLASIPEIACAVEVVACEEVFKHCLAFDAVQQARHPAVFRAYLAVVFAEARRCGAQYGQVDIDEQLLVGVAGRGVMAGGHDQVVNPRLHLRCSSAYS